MLQAFIIALAFKARLITDNPVSYPVKGNFKRKQQKSDSLTRTIWKMSLWWMQHSREKGKINAKFYWNNFKRIGHFRDRSIVLRQILRKYCARVWIVFNLNWIQVIYDRVQPFLTAKYLSRGSMIIFHFDWSTLGIFNNYVICSCFISTKLTIYPFQLYMLCSV